MGRNSRPKSASSGGAHAFQLWTDRNGKAEGDEVALDLSSARAAVGGSRVFVQSQSKHCLRTSLAAAGSFCVNILFILFYVFGKDYI